MASEWKGNFDIPLKAFSPKSSELYLCVMFHFIFNQLAIQHVIMLCKPLCLMATLIMNFLVDGFRKHFWEKWGSAPVKNYTCFVLQTTFQPTCSLCKNICRFVTNILIERLYRTVINLCLYGACCIHIYVPNVHIKVSEAL